MELTRSLAQHLERCGHEQLPSEAREATSAASWIATTVSATCSRISFPMPSRNRRASRTHVPPSGRELGELQR
jgi:hypothetical protein